MKYLHQSSTLKYIYFNVENPREGMQNHETKSSTIHYQRMEYVHQSSTLNILEYYVKRKVDFLLIILT